MRNRVAGYQHPFAVMVVVGRCRLVEVDEHVRRAQANVGAAHSIGCWGSKGFLWPMRQTLDATWSQRATLVLAVDL